MEAATKTQEHLLPSDESEPSNDELLDVVLEELKAEGIEINPATESCVPHIMQGLRGGSFDVDLENPLHKTISHVFTEAGVTTAPTNTLTISQ